MDVVRNILFYELRPSPSFKDSLLLWILVNNAHCFSTCIVLLENNSAIIDNYFTWWHVSRDNSMMLGTSFYGLGLGEDILESTHCMWYLLDSKIKSHLFWLNHQFLTSNRSFWGKVLFEIITWWINKSSDNIDKSCLLFRKPYI